MKIAKLPENEKRMVLKKERKMALVVVEEKEEYIDAESSIVESPSDEFDPAAEVEGKTGRECVRCGRSDYLMLADDDPLQLLCRLIGEFVKSPDRFLCHQCLSEIYGRLGRYIAKNWEKMLKIESTSHS